MGRRKKEIPVTCEGCCQTNRIPAGVLKKALICSYCGSPLYGKDQESQPPKVALELTPQDIKFLWRWGIDPEVPPKQADRFSLRLTERDKKFLRDASVSPD